MITSPDKAQAWGPDERPGEANRRSDFKPPEPGPLPDLLLRVVSWHLAPAFCNYFLFLEFSIP